MGRFLKALYHRSIQKLLLRLRLLARHVLAGPSAFADGYVTTNDTHVTLYTDDGKIVPHYAPRESLSAHLGKRSTRISMIAPVKNEAANVRSWWAQITQQTRPPDEIIVVDGGSTDGTVEQLQAIAAASRVPFRLIVEPGCNIARARNLAINASQYPIIAATDFGCLPQHDWLEKITSPFEADREMRVAAGLYRPIDSVGRSKWRGFPIHPDLARINPSDYLPSSRSIAFMRQVWSEVGGYPEWLSLTGEDTWFDRELQRVGGAWAFVPEASVDWHAPANFLAYCSKVFRWAQGDGESGLHAKYYWRYVLQLSMVLAWTIALFLLAAFIVNWQIAGAGLWLTLAAVLWTAGVVVASRISAVSLFVLAPEVILESVQVAGFTLGSRNRPDALSRRLAQLNGLFVILSGVPIDDTGGGARCTQIALELLRQKFAVVFIHRFPKYETQKLDLNITHPNLFVYALDQFDWNKFLRAEGQGLDEKMLAAIVEFPLREFLPLIEIIRQHKGVVMYDLLDAWDTSLGANWYSPQIDGQIIAASQVLTATTPSLQERLEKQSGRPVTLLPNAVNDRLFDPNRAHARPRDLPSGDWLAIYIGALWGEWFDWELLGRIAAEYPRANIVVIGDYRGQCRKAPPNLHFLGLKAQSDLPAYLAHSDVAIIPWKINPITDATSPLKVFEYLAMHKPVVAPAIAPLRDMPGVWLARDSSEFIRRIDEARSSVFPTARVDDFISANRWECRIDQLIPLVQSARRIGNVETPIALTASQSVP